jgi:hypothetical protein
VRDAARNPDLVNPSEFICTCNVLEDAQLLSLVDIFKNFRVTRILDFCVQTLPTFTMIPVHFLMWRLTKCCGTGTPSVVSFLEQTVNTSQTTDPGVTGCLLIGDRVQGVSRGLEHWILQP